MCRRVALVGLCILGVALAVVLYLVLNITSAGPAVNSGRASAASVPSPPPTVAEVQSAKRTVERLGRQLAPRDTPTRAPTPAPVELRVTEAEVNELVRSLPEVRSSLQKLQVSDARIDFKPGRLTAAGRVRVVGEVRARVAATGRVWLDNGELAYKTEEVRLGDFPAPARLGEELDKQLRRVVVQLNEPLRGRLREVSVTEDELVLRGEE